MEGFENGRLQTAARAVGLMQAAFEAGLDVRAGAQGVRQAGRSTTSSRQAKLARMAALIQAGRQFSYDVARAHGPRRGHARGVDGEGLRVPRGRVGDPRGDAAPRRHGLRRGVPGVALLRRRPRAVDLRGRRRDAVPPRHRPPPRRAGTRAARAASDRRNLLAVSGVGRMWTCPSSSGRARTASTTRSRCHPSGARPSVGRGTTATPTRGAPACRAADSCARCAARRRRSWPSTRARRSRPATRRAAAPVARSPCLPPARSIPTPRAPRSPATSSSSTCRVIFSSMAAWTTPSNPARSGPRVLERVPAAGLRRGRPARVLLGRPLHGGGVPPQRHVDGRAVGAADRTRGQPAVGRDDGPRPAVDRGRVPRPARAAPRAGAPERRRPPGEPRRDERRGGARTRSCAGRCSPTSPTSTTVPGTRGDSTTAIRHSPRSATRSSPRGRAGRADRRRAQGALDHARLHVAVRLARRRRTGRTRASRRALPRVPLGLRGRPRRGPVRPGDRRPWA